MTGGDPGDTQQRQDRDGQDREYEDRRSSGDEVRGRRADRLAQRLDADPHVGRIVERPERPVERREEPDVEDLHEHEHAQDRSEGHDQHAARAGGQQGGQGDDDEKLEREPCERAEVEVARLVRRDEGGPHEQQGEHRGGHGDAGGRVPAQSGVPAPPQPPHALAHRRHEQHECGEEESLREHPRQDPGGRDRQHDPLCGRDELAPAARRQRRAHPRQQPLAREKEVARCPDRQHPRAVPRGDVDAEGEDQERVDLAVEARPQLGLHPGAPRHPAIDQVQYESDGRERHEQRDRRAVRKRARGQRGDADGERGPGERHPGRRGEQSG
jgi:hypothetical protein